MLLAIVGFDAIRSDIWFCLGGVVDLKNIRAERLPGKQVQQGAESYEQLMRENATHALLHSSREQLIFWSNKNPTATEPQQEQIVLPEGVTSRKNGFIKNGYLHIGSEAQALPEEYRSLSQGSVIISFGEENEVVDIQPQPKKRDDFSQHRKKKK